MKVDHVLLLTVLFGLYGCSTAGEETKEAPTSNTDVVNTPVDENLAESNGSSTIDPIGPSQANANCDPNPLPALSECEYLNALDHIVEATIEFIEPRTTPMFSQTGELIEECDGYLSKNMYVGLTNVTALKGQAVDGVWIHRNVFDIAHSYRRLDSDGKAYWSGEELFQPGQRVILPIHELIPGQYMVGLLAYFDVMDGSLTAHAGTLEMCQMWTPNSIQTVEWFHSLPTGCEGVAPAEGMTSQFQNGTVNRANTLPVCQPKD